MTSDQAAREGVADRRTRGPFHATRAGRRWVDWAAAILIFLSGMPSRVELALRHDLPLAGEEPQYQRYARHWALGEGAEPREKAFPWHPLGSFTHRPPGYTLLVGMVLRATGPDDLRSVRLLQSLLDCGSLVLLYALGIAVFGAWTGRAAGLASALLMARYDFLMGFVARILTETFYLFLVLASLGLALLARRSRAALPAAVGGFLMGWAAITRPAALFIAPFLLLWLATLPAMPRRRQLALAAAFGLLLAIAPVTWRNWQLQGRFILIATNGGQVLHDSVARVEDLSAPEDFPPRDALKRPGLGEVDQQCPMPCRLPSTRACTRWLPSRRGLRSHHAALQKFSSRQLPRLPPLGSKPWIRASPETTRLTSTWLRAASKVRPSPPTVQAVRFFRSRL